MRGRAGARVGRRCAHWAAQRVCNARANTPVLDVPRIFPVAADVCGTCIARPYCGRYCARIGNGTCEAPDNGAGYWDACAGGRPGGGRVRTVPAGADKRGGGRGWVCGCNAVRGRRGARIGAVQSAGCARLCAQCRVPYAQHAEYADAAHVLHAALNDLPK